MSQGVGSNEAVLPHLQEVPDCRSLHRTVLFVCFRVPDQRPPQQEFESFVSPPPPLDRLVSLHDAHWVFRDDCGLGKTSFSLEKNSSQLNFDRQWNWQMIHKI